MVDLSAFLRSQDKMKEITKATVLIEHGKEPRRKCFYNNSGVQKRKARPTFSVAIETAKKIFEAQTALELRESQEHQNYWRFIDANEIIKVEAWEQSQGKLIFLRDCLSLSIALDTNFVDNTAGEYTRLGALEHRGKNDRDQVAINELAPIVAQTINALPYYKDADLICAVPPNPNKDFDLPSTVVSLVSTMTGKPNVTSGFAFGGQKNSVKNAPFDQKWQEWDDAQLSFRNSGTLNVRDKTIVLIDDKYQSGITIQYVAMKLQQAGAHKVYGLSFVKTLRDTDNV